MHVFQEAQPYENENIPIEVSVGSDSASKCALIIFIICPSDASIV